MGRPINKRFVGNTSQSGQQIQATAYFAGDTQTRTAYINKQVAASSYNMVNVGGVQSGRVKLVNGGVALNPGEANVLVTPYGATGSGATAANANLAARTATIVSAGTTGYYVPGQVLYSSAGTFTQRANVTVGSVEAGNVVILSAGPGYTVGDTFTWAYAGYDTPVVVTVASTSGNGNVATVSITEAGSVSNISVTNATPYSSSTTTNAWVSAASLRVRWDLNTVGVSTKGDYSVIPSNPLTLIGSSTGSGATANVDWEVSSIRVTANGSGYQSVAVDVAGSAEAIGVVNAAGSVTSIVVTDSGSGYTAHPAVTISTLASTEYAAEIKNRSVTTFNGNSYQWVDSTVTPADGQAKLSTS